MKWEGERERARMLPIFGGSRAIKRWNDARDNVSVESCSPSMACKNGRSVLGVLEEDAGQ